MRNLKRVLALALALVMVIGMMVIGASAAKEADYSEAINVVNGLNVMVGNEKGDFMDKQILTREQAAKILAYIMLGENNAEKLGANAQIFTDVPADKWSAGYIAYCANVGLIDGVGDGSFAPEAPLTGVAFAKLLLGAAGYDADYEGYVNNEEWDMNIAVDAMANGIDVKNVPLSGLVTREQAAQMVFNALEMGLVSYLKGDKIGTIGAFPIGGSVGEKYFGKLEKATDVHVENWGKAYNYVWTLDGGVIATEAKTPVATYYEANTMCDIASDIGLKDDAIFDVYMNGYYNYTDDGLEIDPIKRVDKVGAQGRETIIYKCNHEKGDYGCIVFIDTYLAQVTKAYDPTYDLAGHVIKDAMYELTIYGYGNKVTLNVYDESEYSKGTWVTVNVRADGFDTLKGVKWSDIDAVEITGKANIETVTVDETIKNAQGKNVGIVADGEKYLYNVTYTTAEDRYGDNLPIQNKYIETEVRLWTDAQGNILKWAPVTEGGSAGYGVITAVDTAKVATGKYVALVDVLNADGETETIKVVEKAGEYFKTNSAAEEFAVEIDGRYLVKYTLDKTTKAYTLTAADAAKENKLVEAGVVETLDGGVRVDDTTVFYVAEYTYKNSTEGYVFKGYNIVEGFKNIDDLGIKKGKIDNVKGTDELVVTYLGKDAYGFVDAVLVLNSNLQTTPKTQKVPNYAYLLTLDELVYTSDDAFTYKNVIVNGEAGEDLAVTTAAHKEIDGAGLYTFTVDNANKADTVTKLDPVAGESYYINTAGVLEVNRIEGTKDYEYYFTIADDCVYYVVNELTGDVYAVSMYDAFDYTDCNMYFEGDKNGYISAMYFVEASFLAD